MTVTAAELGLKNAILWNVPEDGIVCGATPQYIVWSRGMGVIMTYVLRSFRHVCQLRRGHLR